MRWGYKAAAKGRIRLHQELSPTTSPGSWLVLWLKSQSTAKFGIRFRVRRETSLEFQVEWGCKSTARGIGSPKFSTDNLLL